MDLTNENLNNQIFWLLIFLETIITVVPLMRHNSIREDFSIHIFILFLFIAYSAKNINLQFWGTQPVITMRYYMYYGWSKLGTFVFLEKVDKK